MQRYAKNFVMFLLAGVALSSSLTSASNDELTGNDFSNVLRSLSSIAGEAVLFLDQLEQNRLTDAYAQTHLEKLKGQLDDDRHKLQQPFPQALKIRHDKALVLADALAAEAAKLNGRLQDKTVIRKAKDEVGRIHYDLARMRA